jgi:mannose-6-phosphate isomerase-like protein (cupin superfamily)
MTRFATPDDNGFFNLRTPLLKSGITTDTRAKTEVLNVTIKVYADGGENEMHAHVGEDHAFVVLSGQATFHVGSNESSRVVNKYEGVMLPSGTEYWFQSTGPNLVMLRVGARRPDLAGAGGGHKDYSFMPEWLPLEGVFFPDDCES